MRRFTRRYGAGLCRAGGIKSIARRFDGAPGGRQTSKEQVGAGRSPASLPPVHALFAVMATRIEAILQLALLVDVMESQIAERDENDDGDQREEIAAAGWGRRLVLAVGSGHAKRLDTLGSTSPSAAIALATMPLASSPAAAYMRSGLS